SDAASASVVRWVRVMRMIKLLSYWLNRDAESECLRLAPRSIWLVASKLGGLACNGTLVLRPPRDGSDGTDNPRFAGVADTIRRVRDGSSRCGSPSERHAVCLSGREI